jgi:NTP pyrophosphatase (non-canonical NTP hydrolase)
MEKKDRHELYNKLDKKLGHKHQLIILIEECGELIRASTKVLRYGLENEKVCENFVEELGDVEICIETMRTITKIKDLDARVNNSKKFKLLRVKKRLEDKEDL